MTGALLSSYPRIRPPLSAAQSRIYEREYKANRDGAHAATAAAQRLEGWMHRAVAARSGGVTLEIGAGTLNHLAYEGMTEAYDIVEPFAALYRDGPGLAAVRSVHRSLADIPATTEYDRIISIATLEHMADLPAELARAGLLLEPGGVFQAGIPSEGGALWWLAWRCTTGLAYWLRNHLDYGELMRHEHLSRAPEIVALVRHFFADVTVRRFPTPFHHVSFYACLEARRPRRARCEAHLAAGAQ